MVANFAYFIGERDVTTVVVSSLKSLLMLYKYFRPSLFIVKAEDTIVQWSAELILCSKNL